MASEASASLAVAGCSGNTEVFSWLKTLPVAPEYHPTLAEFQDPIAYIFKIEKEASRYGICKIVPPVPPPSKKSSIANLNKSLSARSGSGPTFTTRQQQIGFCPRKQRPVQKPVWQSGENYTLPQFEIKAKGFEKNYLKKCYKKNLSPLEVETLYWKATVDKPFSVEYANDMPGSAFAPKKSGKDDCPNEGNANNNLTIAETEWNMRGVSRAKGSLLRFMKEEIPGVTSPMVYIAMMFSWFAWHVEDHDLHSLNYLHMGAGKTWYGVPRDAAVAFEEVIRVQGYGGEINPLVAFATLGEKTTVMSPEVLVDAGVPCCRLVQNPGEFVVTFPRAYHSGFSHGFNCGEAANIATPEWLRVAKDAAIRRASVNCPPMVSHFQLLYDLALSFSSRVPKNIYLEPRSSRLKDKKKGEGELLVKDLFVQDMMQNNNLLHMLADGSSVVILPGNSLGTCSNLRAGQEFQSGFSGICSPDLAMKTTTGYDLEKKTGVQPVPKAYLREMFTPSCVDKRFFSSERGPDSLSLSSLVKNVEGDGARTSWGDRLSEQGLFSCVTCGILCFACVAIVQPTDAAAHNLITADCSTFKDWEDINDATEASHRGDESLPETESSEGKMNKRNADGLFDVLVQSAEQLEVPDAESSELISNGEAQRNTSSLGLLALAYGNSSDSEEDEAEATIHMDPCRTKCIADLPHSAVSSDQETVNYSGISNSETDFLNEIPHQFIRPCVEQELTRTKFETGSKHSWPVEHRTDSFAPAESDNLIDKSRHQPELQLDTSSCLPATHKAETTITSGLLPPDNTTPPFSASSDEDSCRKHVFCLQHAVQVEKRLRSVGGAHILLLCHPDYPKVEARARKLAEELENDNIWGDVSFRQASAEDEKTIRLALESEAAIHGNGDWAVKLGINLYYSANLSRSPLYSKQMPYNFTIYNAFGRSCPTSTMKAEFNGKGPGKLKKIIVAGKWCGKVWMSNQVHQFLAESDHREEERTTYLVKADPKPERFAEKNSINRAPTICKPSRKRKSIEENKSDVKSKLLKAGEHYEAFEDLPLNCSLQQCKSSLKNKQMKREKSEPQIKGAKRKRELSIETEDEPKPRSKIVKNKKEFDIEIEEEPVPQNKCDKSRKQLNAEGDDEPKPRNKGVRSKRELNVEEEEDPRPPTKCAKGKKHLSLDIKNEHEGGPSSRLRKRPSKPGKDWGGKATLKKQQNSVQQQQNNTKGKKGLAVSKNSKVKDEKADFPCDEEGCAMSFGSKQELVLHKRNMCPVKGCGKKFISHKYLVQHRRVHVDDRPLKCPWKGCKMTFKWAWARTEHIRVHTGARPYVCSEPECGQTFRFVSDFSRHKRKTGHSSKKGR